jgi:serine/threonine protein kinase
LFINLNLFILSDIYHRDLKPENILYTKDGIIKICDFGSSKTIEENTKSTPYIVSRYYRAPELLLGCSNYTYSIDLFATGCIFAELFSLNPIFAGKTEGLQLFEHMAILGKPDDSYFQKFKLPADMLNYFTNHMEKWAKQDLKPIINEFGNYNDRDIELAADLIDKCLMYDWENRITAANALKHPFFTDYTK